MSGSGDGPRRTDLETLRLELGLVPTSTSSLPMVIPPQNVVPITVDFGGEDISVWVPPQAKHSYRQKFRELARREKRRAANAGNAANTSQLIGGGIGGTLATGGVIALVSASAPLALPAIIATGIGVAIAGIGLMAGHW